MTPRAQSLARRLSADLADLRLLADLEPEQAEAIRCALQAELASWPVAVSLTERAMGEQP